ncbi:hypothetical protein BKA62DRAFT_625801, partial [Auriculariales sp. MPI-PUGE-AT-0066]
MILTIEDGLNCFHTACGLKACFFCASPNHLTGKCFKRAELVKKWEEERKTYNSQCKKDGKGKGKEKVNTATVDDVSPGAMGFEDAAVSHYVYATSSQLANLASRSSLIATTKWNTDTGCSATMSCRRSYFASYHPHRVGIQLANGHVVFSAGISSVRFIPTLDGRDALPVEFDDVLHVPDL